MLHFFPHHPYGFIVCADHFSHTIFKDVLCMLYTSAPPPTGSYCICCACLSLEAQGSTVYVVHCSHTTHRDFLCMMFVSLSPLTGIYYVCSTHPPHHPQGLTVYNIHFSHTIHRDLLTVCVWCSFLPHHPQSSVAN